MQRFFLSNDEIYENDYDLYSFADLSEEEQIALIMSAPDIADENLTEVNVPHEVDVERMDMPDERVDIADQNLAEANEDISSDVAHEADVERMDIANDGVVSLFLFIYLVETVSDVRPDRKLA